jgi:hypothetical protein
MLLVAVAVLIPVTQEQRTYILHSLSIDDISMLNNKVTTADSTDDAVNTETGGGFFLFLLMTPKSEIYYLHTTVKWTMNIMKIE